MRIFLVMDEICFFYVRWPAEPLAPYLMYREVWADIPFQNLIKYICIHILAVINGPALKKSRMEAETLQKLIINREDRRV